MWVMFSTKKKTTNCCNSTSF